MSNFHVPLFNYSKLAFLKNIRKEVRMLLAQRGIWGVLRIFSFSFSTTIDLSKYKNHINKSLFEVFFKRFMEVFRKFLQQVTTLFNEDLLDIWRNTKYFNC